MLSLLFLFFCCTHCASIGRQTLFPTETILSPKSIGNGSFGLLQSLPVVGQVYAQPLVVPGITLKDGTVATYLIVATMHNMIYAFSLPSHNKVWEQPLSSSCPLPDDNIDLEGCGGVGLTDELGILSTPVVDTSKMVIYVIFHTCTPIRPGTNINHRKFIRALFVQNGTDVVPGKLIDPTDLPGARVPFYANTSNQRAGLSLINGFVCAAFASFCDTSSYAGWIMFFNSSDLSLELTWNTATDKAGIWQSGAPLTQDSTGAIYAVAGNGNYNISNQEYGNSVLKIQPKFQQDELSLSVIDWFTPYDETGPNNLDVNIGSTQAVLDANMLVAGSNSGYVYIMNTSNLGKFSVNNSGVHQFFRVVPENQDVLRALHSVLVWTGPIGTILYSMGESDSLKMFLANKNVFPTTPTRQTSFRAPVNSTPGGILSLSSNAGQNAVLWVTVPVTSDADFGASEGELIAVDANSVTSILWRSTFLTSNRFGNLSKFNPAFVYGGHVYVATFSNKIAVYGLLNRQSPQDYAVVAVFTLLGTFFILGVAVVGYMHLRKRSSYKKLHSDTAHLMS